MSPSSEAELSELISSATGPLALRGGGTRLRDTGGEVLETTALSGITLYEPGALTLVAQAGTTLAEIKAALAAENQRLAFEPPDMRDVLGTQGHSTIGGVVASGASGPRRISVGACRDFMLGVRFVDGSGTVVSNGGRVMKNVTGYDMVKLMTGSWGRLGVLSEVSLKVLPKVEMQLCLRIEGLDSTQAIAAMSTALGSPFEISGAGVVDGAVILRIEGFEASVRYRGERVTALLHKFGAAEIIDDQDVCATLWRDLRDARRFANSDGDLWRISVKPSDAPTLLDALSPKRAMLDWGGGLIWAEVEQGHDLRTVMTMPGHATLIRAAPETLARLGRFHPEPAPLAKISAGLRARFDPRGILNTGLTGGAA